MLIPHASLVQIRKGKLRGAVGQVAVIEVDKDDDLITYVVAFTSRTLDLSHNIKVDIYETLERTTQVFAVDDLIIVPAH